MTAWSKPHEAQTWKDASTQMRYVLIAFFASLLAIGGLVFAIRSGREELAGTAGSEPGSSETQPAGAPDVRPDGTATARPRLVRFGSFDSPVLVTAPTGDRSRVFVVEKGGRIKVVRNGRRSNFLDLSGDVSNGGEQGLLSMAFAPDYASSGKFYVNFTDRSGNTRIQEFTRSSNPNRADKSSRRPLMTIEQPYENHNGGMLAFGPDRMLYIGTGDGGSGGDPENRAQNMNSLLGKMLRIDPNPASGRPYTSPESNPFVGREGRDEIYSFGLRNPWRFTFDRATGDLYIADVGQGEFEEVNFNTRGNGKGVDYGWSCFEGRARFESSRSCPDPVGPKLTTSHSAGNCSITGGVVVRSGGPPSLKGRYLHGDFCLGRIYSVKITSQGATGNRPIGVKRVNSLSSFGEDAKGRVYAMSLEGPVYRIR